MRLLVAIACVLAVAGLLAYLASAPQPPMTIQLGPPTHPEQGQQPQSISTPDSAVSRQAEPPRSAEHGQAPPHKPGAVEQLEALRSTHSSSLHEWEAVLANLLEEGNLELVLEVMTDLDLDFTDKGLAFERLLMEKPERLVYEAARSVLDQRIEKGEVAWFQVGSYAKLLAFNGGDEASRELLELLGHGHEGDTQLLAAAAEAAKHLQTTQLPSEYVDLIKSAEPYDPISRTLAASLVACPDRKSARTILEIADSHERGSQFRYEVFKAYGEGLPEQESAEFARRYWNDQDQDVLAGVVRMALNEKIPPEARRDQVVPIVLDALSRDEEDHWGQALKCLIPHSPAVTDHVLSQLEHLGESTEDKEKARRLLARYHELVESRGR